jgi:hypothetical protein
MMDGWEGRKVTTTTLSRDFTAEQIEAVMEIHARHLLEQSSIGIIGRKVQVELRWGVGQMPSIQVIVKVTDDGTEQNDNPNAWR